MFQPQLSRLRVPAALSISWRHIWRDLGVPAALCIVPALLNAVVAPNHAQSQSLWRDHNLVNLFRSGLISAGQAVGGRGVH